MAPEFWIALAGPLASVILTGICYLGLKLMHHWMHWLYLFFASHHPWLHDALSVLRLGCVLNILIAFFNVLPCFPLDGGRMLRGLLAMALARFTKRSRSSTIYLATWIVVRFLSWPVAIGMVVLAIYLTDFWLNLIIFPVLLMAGEIECSERRPRTSVPAWIDSIPEENIAAFLASFHARSSAPRMQDQ